MSNNKAPMTSQNKESEWKPFRAENVKEGDVIRRKNMFAEYTMCTTPNSEWYIEDQSGNLEGFVGYVSKERLIEMIRGFAFVKREVS